MLEIAGGVFLALVAFAVLLIFLRHIFVLIGATIALVPGGLLLAYVGRLTGWEQLFAAAVFVSIVAAAMAVAVRGLDAREDRLREEKIRRGRHINFRS